MKKMVPPPLLEVTRVAILGGIITAMSGPTWFAYDEQCQAMWHNDVGFYMHTPTGHRLDIYLDEDGPFTIRPTWRTSADYAFTMHLYRLPRFDPADRLVASNAAIAA